MRGGAGRRHASVLPVRRPCGRGRPTSAARPFSAARWRAMAPLASAPLLTVRDVTMRFGGIVALDGVSFDMADGQIVGLIGPNGAGKTTLFNCVSRLYTPDRGDLLLRGASIMHATAHRIAALGV